MVGQIVSTWNGHRPPSERKLYLTETLRALEGSWVNEESDTNIHIRIINETIVAPYCYGGNKELMGCYYDWEEIGEYFVRQI
jgi:hypothetical protein